MAALPHELCLIVVCVQVAFSWRRSAEPTDMKLLAVEKVLGQLPSVLEWLGTFLATFYGERFHLICRPKLPPVSVTHQHGPFTALHPVSDVVEP